jgi:hypothetical protein
MEEKNALQIPEPPEIRLPGWPGYPPKVVERYKAAYGRALKEAEAGQSGESLAHQAAAQEAAKAIRSAHPESYEEAMALPEWELMPDTRRTVDEQDGNGNLTGKKVLRGMTIHGHAFRRPTVKGQRGLGPLGFIVPEPKAKPQIVKDGGKPKDGDKPAAGGGQTSGT